MYRYHATTTIPNWLAKYISPTKEFEKCNDKYSNAGLSWIRMYMEAKYGQMMTDLVCLKNDPMFGGSTINIIMENMYDAKWRQLGADMTDFHRHPRQILRIMRKLAFDKTVQRVLMDGSDFVFRFNPKRLLVRQLCSDATIVEMCEKAGLYDVGHLADVMYGDSDTPKKNWFKIVPGIGMCRAKSLEKVILPKSRWTSYQDLDNDDWKYYELQKGGENQ